MIRKKTALTPVLFIQGLGKARRFTIGMCGCTKIRCFVRLKTPKTSVTNYQQLTKHLNACDFCLLLNMHKSYTLFKKKLF